MKVIPTRYQGVQMRSRLEADWALTLDDRGIVWQYVPEGFELSDGTWYCPDFYLPGVRAWLEVKGDHMQRLSKVEQFAADLWAESGAQTTSDHSAPMVLLGLSPGINDSILRGIGFARELARMHGVMGPGKAYSVGFSRCPRCEQPCIVAFWQTTCRLCRATFASGSEAFRDPWMDEFKIPFCRFSALLKRPEV